MAFPGKPGVQTLTREEAGNAGDDEGVALPCGVRIRGVSIDQGVPRVPGRDAYLASCTPGQAGPEGPHTVLRAERPAAGAGSKPLGERESEVLSMLVEGGSDKEIAEALGVSRSTVQSHVGSLYRKTGATNRVQLGALARDLGLVHAPGPMKKASGW